jgi:plastocyanin
MRRRPILLALLGLLGAALAPAAASADTTTVRMPGKYFDPARPIMVAGDVVVFRNEDLVTHDVRIGAGLFDSGAITHFRSWSQQIDRPGGYPFICTLHRFMSGNLDVLAATLAATPRSVLAGEPLALSGRAPAGTARVGVERSVSGGAWIAVGATAPAPDGHFEATVPAVEGASYRVTTPAGASPPVVPSVQAGVDVHVRVRHRRAHTLVLVHTMPATGGLTATLELYSRWHFRWRPQRRQAVRLGAGGRARFRLPASRQTFARVALSRRRGAPALARSGVVSLRTGRAASDPDAIVPFPGGDHDGGGGPHSGHGIPG